MTNTKIRNIDPTVAPDAAYRDNVRELQIYLRQLSFYNQNIPQVAIDGVYGPETVSAVQTFQTDAGLNPTGVVDLLTWNAIVKRYNEVITQSKIPNPIFPFPSADYVLSPGTQSNLVIIIQIILNTISKFYINLESIPLSGIYDQETQEAVRKIQSIMLIEPTGNVDLVTWDTLANAYNAFK